MRQGLQAINLVVTLRLSRTVTLPLVPSMVTVDRPMGVNGLYPAESVSVAVPDVATEAGEKLALTPTGSPIAESATVPVNP
jgi:hypothetical protein